MPLSDTERSLQAKAAAYALHSQRDSRELTEAARAGRWAKLLATVDPDGVLPEPERVRRAEALRKSQLYFAALKSSRVRAAKKASTSPKVKAQEVERASAHTTRAA
ncbi:MAG: hypothetical protein H0U13_10825 [Gemmatimonadaceae bacterium]|nr:hypothetical protein [Gemmatimonadaceae bacterium]